MEQSKKRTIDLKRQIWLSNVESQAINLPVGGSFKVELLDMKCYQSIRVRFNRYKNRTGICFFTNLKSNILKITRENIER